MKKVFSLLLAFSFVLVLCGCQNSQTKAPEGAVVGGLLGAAAGAGIGSLSGHAGAGAGIGAAVGAISGGLIGGQMEKKPQEGASGGTDPNATQMSSLQIIELSKQGTPDNVIIDRIKKSNSKFNLSNEDIEYLQNQGVSEKVIAAMKGI